MTDRELLELAAKAAGEKPVFHSGVCYLLKDESLPELIWWNPLRDDAAALRLAVDLGINIYLAESGFVTAGRIGVQGCREQLDCNQMAATRRAIVCAAAAIGEAVP